MAGIEAPTFEKLMGKTNYWFCPLFIIIILFPVKSVSQSISPEYSVIKQSLNFNIDPQKTKVDSLFVKLEQQGRLIELAADIRDYAILNYLNGEIGQSTIYLKKGSDICEKLVPYNENFHKRLLFNWASFHRDNGEHELAIEVYKKLINTGNPDDLSAEAHSKIGLNYMELGDLYNALLYHDQAQKLLSERKMFHELIVDSHDAANTYAKINRRPLTIRGIQNLLKAERLNDSLLNALNYPSDYTTRIRTFRVYINLGKLLHDDENMQHLGNATDYYYKALQVSQNLKDSFNIAGTMNSLGALYKGKGKLDSAQMILLKALEYSRVLDQRSLIYLNLSEVELQKNNLPSALELSEKSIYLATHWNKKEVSPEAIDIKNYNIAYDKLALLKILKVRIDIWRKYYESTLEEKYLENAFQLVTIADMLIDNIRQHSTANDSKLFWQKQATTIYTTAVNICYLMSEIGKAYYFMEKNKAILLLEDLIYERRKNADFLTQNIKSLDLNFKKSILKLEETLSYTSDGKKDSIKTLLFNQKQHYSLFIDSLKPLFPSYYYVKSPVEITDYNTAREEGNIIEYILPNENNEPKGYLLFTNKDQEHLYEISDVKLLNEKLDQYRSMLSQPFVTIEDKNTFEIVSTELCDLLIPEEIRKIVKNQEVIIIPDGRLQNIPFDALIDSNNDGKYLIESINISYAYSVSFSKENEVVKRSPKEGFLGFAPVNFDYGNLPDLNESEIEINDIVNLLGGDAYIHKNATSEDFKNIIKNYKIIHLSTHADANDSIAPWIAFSDKLVTLNDLYTLENEAELVVLSACNTAKGELQTGEGVMSLARGFFYSGANSVLSSLWSVNDKSSRELITEFYANLKDGESKSVALRNAKLSYIKTHSLSSASPYYWASFILIGDTEQVEFSSMNIMFWMITGLLLLLILVGFIQLKKRMQKG